MFTLTALCLTIIGLKAIADIKEDYLAPKLQQFKDKELIVDKDGKDLNLIWKGELSIWLTKWERRTLERKDVPFRQKSDILARGTQRWLGAGKPGGQLQWGN